jgi:hypothetical protein
MCLIEMNCSSTNNWTYLFNSLQLVLMITNLIIIAYIFRNTKNVEKQKRIFDKKSSWFFKLIIESHLGDIEIYYSSLVEDISKLQSHLFENKGGVFKVFSLNDAKGDVVSKLSDKFRNYNQSIIVLINVLSESLAAELFRENEVLRDQLIESIDNIKSYNKREIEIIQAKIIESKINFLNKLYVFDVSQIII